MSRITWRKSSYTSQEGGTSVEVADLGNAVQVRDSTDPGGPVLRFGRGAVAASAASRAVNSTVDARSVWPPGGKSAE